MDTLPAQILMIVGAYLLGSINSAILVSKAFLLKGLIPVLAVDLFTASPPLVAATGVAALLGHMYPIYYGFKGGKGVATTLGVLLGFDWWLGVMWIAFWLFTALLFRYSSLAALVATTLILIYSWFLSEDIWFFISITIITIFVFWRHRSNIQNLLNGKESKLGRSRQP